MSSRRSRQAAGVSRISDDQIIELVSKLRQLLPEIRDRRPQKVHIITSYYFHIIFQACTMELISVYQNTDLLSLHVQRITIILDDFNL